MRKQDVVQEFATYGHEFVDFLDQKAVEARSSMAKLQRQEEKAAKKAAKAVKSKGDDSADTDAPSGDVPLPLDTAATNDLLIVTGDLYAGEESDVDDADTPDDPDIPDVDTFVRGMA